MIMKGKNKKWNYIFTKFVVFIVMISFLLSGCGGSGGGVLLDINNSVISDKNVVSSITITPVKYASNINSLLTVYVKALNVNGQPVKNESIYFSVSSLDGNSNILKSIDLSNEVVKTDTNGIATVKVSSRDTGYVKITARSSSSSVVDTKVVYFHDSEYFNSNINITPVSVTIDVDKNRNGIFNEKDDFNVCDSGSNNNIGGNGVNLRVKTYVYNKVYGKMAVTLAADNDDIIQFHGIGSNLSKTVTVTTDTNGEAYLNVVVKCVLQPSKKVVNILATTEKKFFSEFNKSFNGSGVVSLYMMPVFVSKIKMSMYPDSIATGETGQLRIEVSTTAGVIPDGASIYLSSTCGLLDPVNALTNKGIAMASYTAPSVILDGKSCTIYANIGGVTESITIELKTKLSVIPSSLLLVNGDAVGSTATVVIVGGRSPYYVSSSSPYITTTLNGNIITVSVIGNFTGNASIFVRDSAGDIVNVSVIVASALVGTLDIIPSSVNLVAADPDASSATATIINGTAPYYVGSSSPYVTATITGNVVTIRVTNPAFTGEATIMIRDSKDKVGIIKVNVDSYTKLDIIPSSVNLAAADPDASSTTATITNGIAPYYVGSSSPYVTATITGNVVTIRVINPAFTGEATITIKDSKGKVGVITVKVDSYMTLDIIPSSVNLVAADPDASSTTAIITNGIAPYYVGSSSPYVTATITGNVVTISVINPAFTGEATITIKDSKGKVGVITVTVI